MNRTFFRRLNFAFQFEDLFKPYTKYCFEQKPCQEYIKQRYRDNDLFRIYVAVSLNIISMRSFFYLKKFRAYLSCTSQS